MMLSNDFIRLLFELRRSMGSDEIDRSTTNLHLREIFSPLVNKLEHTGVAI